MRSGGDASAASAYDAGEDSGRPWGLRTVLVRHADFRRLFAGSTVSLFGSSVTTVALPLTSVVCLHASATEMGVLSAVMWLPHLVLGLPAGVWVGRMPYRRVLIIGDVSQMLLIGAIPALAALGLLRMWHLYVVMLLAGVANLFATVAAQSLTPQLVPRDQLLPANSALMLSNATVNTTGSALGGLLVAALTAPIAMVVDAVSFLVSSLFKMRIQASGRVDTPAAETAAAEERQPTHLRAGIVEGWRAVFAHPVMRAVVTAATVGAFAGQTQAVVLMLYLVRDIGLPAGQVGALVALSGVAGVVGALTAPRITRRLGPGPAFIAGMSFASVSGLVLAAATGPFVAVFAVLAVAQLLRGAGPSLYGINQQTFRQALIPAELLSRVNATWRFLAFGGQSIGALAGGAAGTALGSRATLVAGSCLMLAGTVVALLSPVRRLRELTDVPRP
ncbi:MFS transporter [Microbispora sp. RL4-1S]|uniref:MFS transporter n=1 Tax=Microbispora oryzae TaxID=2806554 RepID=A0A941AIE4_9ACTN|nr:MFS transporter [Microbispora oryzae]MBP2705071.1 MFS transporter [Microbispora oryzae]